MELTPVKQNSYRTGARWAPLEGVNRTVSQIHALLYIVGVPLPAEEIVILGVARSNVRTF